ncbi:hypothetical protein C9I49_24570 [Pseudomonas prosekii]|uniref:Uncharacterized protein n=1 Tax=Pseudomonas prosekii TaxID=1148509 RepID=A0A2U2D218_9PSED|nr:hypothetical protein C9I49_24570 [Pseudomonas prosekii]
MSGAYFEGTKIPCRSEPARDSGGSCAINVACASIASRLTPTGKQGVCWNEKAPATLGCGGFLFSEAHITPALLLPWPDA